MNHTLTCKACFVHGKKTIKIEDRQLTYTDNDVLVKIEAGGICGSDIHYYQEGHAGLSVLKHPMVICHEFTGSIAKAPTGSNLKVGQKVVINPSQPCNQCEFCLQGKQNQCPNMRFMGSAQYNPHNHGGFSQYVVVSENQCFTYDERMSAQVMTFTEPTTVAIHAVNVAGSLVGKRVLVIGAGPIGGLIIAAAKASGAVEIVAADISKRCRKIAIAMGADLAIDPLDKASFETFSINKGYFDVTFEASGATSAIASTVAATRANGVVVQVGMGASPVQYPVAQMLAKELTWKGSFRFTDEFAVAVKWLEKGIINPQPLISSEFNYQQVEQALITATDKNISSKVIVTFFD